MKQGAALLDEKSLSLEGLDKPLPVDDPVLPAGATVGIYEVVGHIATGTISRVYKVRHPSTQQIEALKMPALSIASDAGALARYMDAARNWAALHHPNIAAILSVTDGIASNGASAATKQCYLTMEWVDGTDLRSLLRARGRLSPGEALPVLRGIAGALDFARTAGAIHGDVKPSNVLLHAVPGSSNAYIAKIADFGMARARWSQQNPDDATSNRYAAPEHAQGESKIGPASDQYSLAVIAYEMLTGRTPSSAASPADRTAAIPPLAGLGSDAADKAVTVVLTRGLAPSPKDRYPTCCDLIDALEMAIGRAEAAIPSVTPPPPPLKAAGPRTAPVPTAAPLPLSSLGALGIRNPKTAAAGALAVVAVLALVGIALHRGGSSGAVPASSNPVPAPLPATTPDRPRVAGDFINGGFENDYWMTKGTSPAFRIRGSTAGSWSDLTEHANLDVVYSPDANNPHGGKMSQKIFIKTPRATPSNAVVFGQPVDLAPGTACSASLWVRADREPAHVEMLLRQSAAPNKVYALKEFAIGKDWQRIAVEGTVGTRQQTAESMGNTEVLVRLWENGAVWLDDAAVTSKSAAKLVPVTFAVHAAHPETSQSVRVVGNLAVLGDFNTAGGLVLRPQGSGPSTVWKGTVELPVGANVLYQYVLWDGRDTDTPTQSRRQITVPTRSLTVDDGNYR